MNPLLKRITTVVVVIELVYLAVGNLALRLPMTQSLLNKMRPDKFEVTWDAAWTWYPFRVHAHGISANGQSRRQQWQLELPTGSASISLLPLILKRVVLSDLYGEDVKYFQRPRLKPDNDYADTRAFFPPIRNRELNMAEPLPTGKKPWTISIRNARVSGRHNVWFYQVRGSIDGKLQADIRYRTRGGPLSVENGKADVTMDEVVINGDHNALRDVAVTGSVEFSEFVPRENKGLRSLPYLTVHTAVSGEVDSLAFLNLYLRHFEGMRLAGKGRVAGQVNFEKGTLLAATRLDVSAPELSLTLLKHRADGSGDVKLEVSPETAGTLSAAVRFNELVARRVGNETPLFTGDGLSVDIKGETDLFPAGGERPHASYLAVTIPAVKVPDLAVYQHYIPDHLGLRFHAGEGELHGKAVLDTVALNADLKLESDNADIGIKDYRFKADVDVALLAETPSDGSEGLGVAGSYIRLSGASLANKDKKDSEPWQAYLAVDEGLLNFHARDEVADNGMLQAINDQDARTMLDTADGKLLLTGNVSSLGWLNQLLKSEKQVTISGASDIKAQLLLQDGWLATGSWLEVLPVNLVVTVLDYIAVGEGAVELNLEKGGERPDVRIDVQLSNANFKRLKEDKAIIDHVEMQLQASARDLSFNGPGEDITLRLKIPAATVTDMSVYNLYLPENSPLYLLEGEADLVADITLEPLSAHGFVTLKTRRLRSRLDEQEIAGDMTVNINVAGGQPENMAFDITGSTLLLDNIKVLGNKESLQDADWYAGIVFTRANTVWKKPVRLKAEADIEMKDSTPIVAMLSNHSNKNGWIEKLLTVGKIEGVASMDMQQNQVVFPRAFAGSDKIDVGAKGIITKETRDGVVFARYRKLKGLLKIRNGKRSFDVIKAQKKFDEYAPEAVIK
jgi:hypothetical protein